MFVLPEPMLYNAFMCGPHGGVDRLKPPGQINKYDFQSMKVFMVRLFFFFYQICLILARVNTKIHYTNRTNLQELPFNGQTDYDFELTFKSAKTKIIEKMEHNEIANFIKDTSNFTSSVIRKKYLIVLTMTKICLLPNNL